MKALFRLLLCPLLAAFFFPVAAGAGYSFDFKIEKKKLEGKRSATLERQVSDEKWCYGVTIDNRSFKDISNVEIKYIIYSRNEVEGSKVAREKQTRGGATAAVLQNNVDFFFQTDPVVLQKSQLTGGFYYDNGAKSRSHDSLIGIWIRLYENGTMVGEYADPPKLSSGKWEE